MIRPPLPTDQGYIASTWARSVLSTHAHQRHFSSRTGEQVGKQIDAVLDRPDTRGLVVCSDRDRDHILAWLLYCDGPSTPVVFYLYTRRDDRGVGHAAALLSRIGVTRQKGVVCTSLGPSSESMRGRFKASVYVPLQEFLK
jgi:hypothetical protein